MTVFFKLFERLLTSDVCNWFQTNICMFVRCLKMSYVQNIHVGGNGFVDIGTPYMFIVDRGLFLVMDGKFSECRQQTVLMWDLWVLACFSAASGFHRQRLKVCHCHA